MEWKNDFYGPMDNPGALVNWNGNQQFVSSIKIGLLGALIKFYHIIDDLKSQGKVRKQLAGYEYDLPETGGIIVQNGGLTFVANRTPEGKKSPVQ